MSMSLSRAGPTPENPTSPSASSATQVGSLLAEDVAPALDPLVHLLAAVVEDPLRHQSRVRVVPHVEVQVPECLGVAGTPHGGSTTPSGRAMGRA